METILVHAQTLAYTLLGLMPTAYQRDNLQALLGLFLADQGQPLPQPSAIKSLAALSRLLNHYDWTTRAVIRAIRPALCWHNCSSTPPKAAVRGCRSLLT